MKEVNKIILPVKKGEVIKLKDIPSNRKKILFAANATAGQWRAEGDEIYKAIASMMHSFADHLPRICRAPVALQDERDLLSSKELQVFNKWTGKPINKGKNVREFMEEKKDALDSNLPKDFNKRMKNFYKNSTNALTQDLQRKGFDTLGGHFKRGMGLKH